MPSLNFPIDPDKLAAHVIRPQHVTNVISNRGQLDDILCPDVQFPGGQQYQFDSAGFVQALDAALTNSVVGYVMQLREHGTAIQARQQNGAKIPPDGTQAWTADVRMHIASCSKIVTAIAMTKVLNDNGISPDTPIISYLPNYWDFGLNIKEITFRHLMTHTSGFNTGRSPGDFWTIKSAVATGVNDHGRHATDNDLGYYRYENMNFGICRILMAVITGVISTDKTFPPPPDDANDRSWDFFTINAYAKYVRDHIFAPAGVTGPTLGHPPEDALAYSFPAGSRYGWDSGDLTSVCGGEGWHMSANELLDVMGAFRRGGNILSAPQAQAMLAAGFGIDVTCSTPLGPLYGKNGFWTQYDDGPEEQGVAYFLPQDMELVVLCNSPVTSTDELLLKLVTNTYFANIKAV
jgi:CubicO group peptidase (beta-lactamase class C family)